MKVLSLSGYFRLPDDFDGGFTDAVGLLHKYLEQKRIEGKGHLRNYPPVGEHVDMGDIYRLWLQDQKEESSNTPYPLVIVGNVSAQNPEMNDIWVSIDKDDPTLT
jgi:hypothetical protein